jgi:hypothetical protein
VPVLQVIRALKAEVTMMSTRNLFKGGLLFVALVSSACSKPSMQEISRITSPDSVVDAVLIERGVGATVATPSEIYIVPKGGKVTGEPLLRGDHMDKLTLIWKQSRLLEVSYAKGRIFSFRNFWESADVQNWTYIVELKLTKVSDTAGMN